MMPSAVSAFPCWSASLARTRIVTPSLVMTSTPLIANPAASALRTARTTSFCLKGLRRLTEGEDMFDAHRLLLSENLRVFLRTNKIISEHAKYSLHKRGVLRLRRNGLSPNVSKALHLQRCGLRIIKLSI